MRKDAKYGLAIGAAVVAFAVPWMIIAKHHTAPPASLPKLLATASATQPAKAQAAVAVRYYRDHADNLFRRSSGATVLIAPHGAFVTCPIRHGRAYAILKNGRGATITILRSAANGSLLGTIRVTDDDALDLVTSLDSMIVLPTGRFFVEAELNPSNRMGIDAGPSDHHCFDGCVFTPNAAGKSIAYFWNPPGAPPDIPSIVYIDGRPVRDIPNGSGEMLRWESDGRTLDVKIADSPIFRLNVRPASAITGNHQ